MKQSTADHLIDFGKMQTQVGMFLLCAQQLQDLAHLDCLSLIQCKMVLDCLGTVNAVSDELSCRSVEAFMESLT